METYFFAVLFGLIQGVAEFFPISSSGHLLILHNLFPVFDSKSTALSFDVALHVSVLLILLIVYWGRLREYLRIAIHREQHPKDQVLWFLIIGTIPALVVGYFFEDVIETTVRSLAVVATTLILGGVLFFAVERWGRQQQSFEQLTWWKAFLIGCGQALALIPGMSRSGMTIIASMALGLQREAATHFAFLLGIPIFFLAGSRRLYQVTNAGVSMYEISLFVIGFVSAAAVGLFCVRFLLRYVQTHTFIPFAVYRIVVGIVIFAVLFTQN